MGVQCCCPTEKPETLCKAPDALTQDFNFSWTEKMYREGVGFPPFPVHHGDAWSEYRVVDGVLRKVQPGETKQDLPAGIIELSGVLPPILPPYTTMDLGEGLARSGSMRIHIKGGCSVCIYGSPFGGAQFAQYLEISIGDTVTVREINRGTGLDRQLTSIPAGETEGGWFTLTIFSLSDQKMRLTVNQDTECLANAVVDYTISPGSQFGVKDPDDLDTIIVSSFDPNDEEDLCLPCFKCTDLTTDWRNNPIYFDRKLVVTVSGFVDVMCYCGGSLSFGSPITCWQRRTYYWSLLNGTYFVEFRKDVTGCPIALPQPSGLSLPIVEYYIAENDGPGCKEVFLLNSWFVQINFNIGTDLSQPFITPMPEPHRTWTGDPTTRWFMGNIGSRLNLRQLARGGVDKVSYQMWGHYGPTDLRFCITGDPTHQCDPGSDAELITIEATFSMQ